MENAAENVAFQLLDHAERHGSRPALWVGGATWDYATLGREACRMAHVLAGLDSPACAVLGERGFTAYRAAVACLLAGKTYVPLGAQFPAERMLEMVERSGAGVIVCDEASLKTLEFVATHASRPLTLCLPELGTPPAWSAAHGRHRFVPGPVFEAAPATRPEPPAEPGRAAYLLFTSGSTGRPKGVAVGHEGLSHYVRSILARYPEIGPADRCTQFFDPTFDLSLHDLWITWAAGACLYAVPRNELFLPLDFVRRHRINVWFSVPSLAAGLRQLKLLSPGALEHLKLGLFCGEALTGELVRDWLVAAPQARLENLYGPTEATIACTAHRVRAEDAGDAFIPIGAPLAGMQALIVDAQMEPVAPGEVGELCIAGPQLALGYWNDAATTGERFVALPGSDGVVRRWYRTGDLARLDPQGLLRYHGRSDRQVKIRGFRVELQEIECALRELGDTGAVAVLPMPANAAGVVPGVVACVAGFTGVPRDLLKACKTRLPAYMVPGAIHVLEHIPLNTNGKTDYPALARQVFGA